MLNTEQKLAADHFNGPCLVTAIPGSGKTSTLTTRVINLVKKYNVEPQNILCLTFTNKAANEMKERISANIGDVSEKIWISTFHYLCLKTLRKYGDRVGLSSSFTIYDDKDQKLLIKKIARMQGIENITDPSVNYISKVINDFREELEDGSYFGELLSPEHSSIASEYLSILDEFNAIDFSGMLYKMWQVLQNQTVSDILSNRFKYVLVDEGQDTNKIQYEIVKKIAAHQNLFVVGDYCQSIFSFRSARPENLKLMMKDFTNVQNITLYKNYRSTSKILESAERLIKKNEPNVTLKSERGDGYSVHIADYLDQNEESISIANRMLSFHNQGYKWKDMAILYRINSQSQALEMACRIHSIPYRVVGGFSFFNRKEIKDALSYLKFLCNPDDTISFARAISEPARKISDITIGKIERVCQKNKISIIDACDRIDQIPGISSSAKNNLRQFIEVTQQYKKKIGSVKMSEIANGYLLDTGYFGHIENLSKEDSSSKRRIDNLNQLIVSISDYEQKNSKSKISDYLQSVQILSEQINEEDDDDAVSLMTMHSSKGLEFPVVHIISCNEKIIPYYLSVSESEIEEERRLMYVGMTRAMDRLHISYCKSKKSKFGFQKTGPSIFLSELSGKEFDKE